MPEALYRRYRPETFADVIGQEHVTEPLSQALRKDHVHHAYLFSGPRGCGKTTSARILARCLNCAQGPTPTPCGVCQSCTDLARGGPGSLDVIEIDAASHGGVDDARDLREKAFFSPSSSPYKIYIVDEAHMVSPQGFNALLKVVEEPPPHLKFIFATTEPEKVIGTIRSRTHHYPFRLVPPSRLQEHLAGICASEGVAVAPGVLPLVVRAGRGSVRDALSVLDQLVAGAGDSGVTYELATALLGYTDTALLDAAIDALGAGDGASAFLAVDRVIEGGLDPRRFAEDLLERLRDLVVLAAVPDSAGALLAHLPADEMERMRVQAAGFGSAGLSRAADIVSAGLTEMRGTTTPRLQLELTVARVLLPAAEGGERALATRLERMERLVAGGVAMGVPTVPDEVARTSPVSPRPRPVEQPPAAPAQQRPAQERPVERAPEPVRAQPDPAPAAAAAAVPPAPVVPVPAQAPSAPAASSGGAGPRDLGSVREMWPVVLGTLASLKRTTWTLVSSQSQVVGAGEGVLTLAFPTPGLREQFAGRSDHAEFVRQALIDVLGVDWRIEAVVGGPGAAPAARQEQRRPEPAAPAPAPQPDPPAPPGQQAQPQPTEQPVRSEQSPSPRQPEQRARDPRPAPDQPRQDPPARQEQSDGSRSDAARPDAARPDAARPGAARRAPAREPEPPGWDDAPPSPEDEETAPPDPAQPEPAPLSPRARALAAVAGTAGRPAAVPPEHDEPAADDQVLDDDGLSGIALLQRDLGARVIGEYDNA